MSTIEKAAAKLAARGKSTVERKEASGVSQTQSEGRVSEPVMQGKRQGFTSAPEQFCDIDLTHLVAKGYLRPGEGKSQLAQEMRRIKRPLLLNIQKSRAKGDAEPATNLIMITSALQGEGKTFIAINLAMSLAAELDHRVLLVDADVSKGDITEQLEIEAQRGLSDLLHETNYIDEDAVLTSNVERLSILPAGGNTDHIDELYASELMGTIARSLASADPDRVVVFDAPPILVTTEAVVLARYMGQVVVVVEANKTPQDAVGQAVRQLEGCANVSMLLNKTSHRESGGYGYGYGYGYAHSKRRQAEASQDDSMPVDREVQE